jgi:hypothetical protein
MSEQQNKLDELMKAMPKSWRKRWCRNNICGCMGAANCSGELIRNGFTEDDWLEWCNNNESLVLDNEL